MKPSIVFQYLLPKRLITQIAGKVANCQCRWLVPRLIGWFVKRYQVNMAEAATEDIRQYASFNAFFTRALKATARPLAAADFCSPVDGSISQLGDIRQAHIFQAKGHQYTTLALLAGDIALASRFDNGLFACLYLSPKDYHRIHMPCDGVLQTMTYVPGDLFSVNPDTAANVPNLFARNERVICTFTSATNGHFVMVLVGATIVGSIATAWHGVVNPPRRGTVTTWHYQDQGLHYKQAEEMGQFLLGSTVVLLFEKNKIAFNADWQPAGAIRFGQAMGNHLII